MTFLYGFIAGWWAASLLCCIAWWKLHRPKAPTLHRRKYRDLRRPETQTPLQRVDNPYSCIDCGTRRPMDGLSWGLCVKCRKKAIRDLPLPEAPAPWEREPDWVDVGEIDYKHLGMTGLEE